MLGNANQLEQIFMNMLLNARDALAEEWTAPVIRIEMNACEIPAGSESQPGPYVRICVEDNGEGMDEERRRRIFDPFFTT